MKLKDEFDKKQGKKWLVPWSDKKEIEYLSAYIRFLESKIDQLTIPAVVGQSEQLKCDCCNGTGMVEGDYRDELESCLTCNGRGTF